MKDCLILMKLGGSLITDKKKPRTFKAASLRHIAEEIGTLHNHGVDFILGTGAGSFGHFPAHKYGLREGAQSPRQLYGMCITHNATQRLSGLVADELTTQNLPIFTLSPSSFVTCQNKKVFTRDIAPIANLLAQKIIPIVHGDTITDTSRGTTILSTEKVLQICLEKLRHQYRRAMVVYLLDIDGVLDKNSRLISRLAPSDSIAVHETLSHDISGGILGKIQSARSAAILADDVYLLNGTVSGLLQKAVEDKPVGTRVLA